MLVVAALMPHFFSDGRVYSGDEPHYLVFLHSLIEDGDLALANNYAAVHAGSAQAGRRARGTPLEHHSVWFADGQKQHWFEVYQASAHYQAPSLRPGVAEPAPHDEYPWNLPGLALLLAPLAAPFRGTPWVEPAALFGIALALLCLMAAQAKLLEAFSLDRRVVLASVAATVLATPLWNYGRCLFPEVPIAAMLLGAIVAYLRYERPGVAGVFAGLAVFFKPMFLVAALPIGIDLLLRRKLAPIASYALGIAFFAGAGAVLNAWLYGSPLRTGPEFVAGSIDAIALLMVSDRGLLPFAPVALLALVGWAPLLRTQRRAALITVGPAVLYYLFVAAADNWDGGYSYGPRYLVAILPLMMVGLAGLERWRWNQARVAACAALVSLSLVINVLGAFPYSAYWRKHPLIERMGIDFEYRP